MLSRALGTESSDDLFICFNVGAADQIDAVGNGCKNAVDGSVAVPVLQAFERFRNGFGLPGEIENQRGMVRRFAQHPDLTRKNRGRNKVSGNGAHLFAEARHLARRNRKRRLGRHVAAGRCRRSLGSGRSR